MDDSVITCNRIIKSYDEETNLSEKKTTCKTQSFHILPTFLLISIALLIVFSIYCYLIKYRTKQKHILPFHDTNNEFRKILY